MNIDRRKFFRIGGLFAVGLGAMPLARALAGGQSKFGPDANALPGKKWAMVVDVRKCDNCNDCVTTCHTTNNVPNIENPHEVIKWIWPEKFFHALPNMQHAFTDNATINKKFMLMCNHCDKPACVNVCPTRATFKKANGIVAMDYHRCIGCRYCMAGCPYGARSFNFRDPRPYISNINPELPTRTKGVVEKCNFCEQLLAVGKPPACVSACKNGALVFGDLDDPNSDVRKILSTNLSFIRKPEYGLKPNVYYIV